jgi:hypothetical protein
MQNTLKDLDKLFKQKDNEFINFTDVADVADNYFQTFKFLEAEVPSLKITVTKIRELVALLQSFLDNGVLNNINYDETFYNTEINKIKVYIETLDKCDLDVIKLEESLIELDKVRPEVTEKKFTDSHLVGKELSKVMDQSNVRDACRKEQERIINGMKTSRDQY